MSNLSENIYTYKGKDITLTIVSLTRQITNMIQDEYDLPFVKALSKFYRSDVYKKFADTENGFWMDSPYFIMERFVEEQNKKN